MISEEEYKKALEVINLYEKENKIKSYRVTKPTDDEISNMFIDFQWGLGAPDLYFEGLEDGFDGAFDYYFKSLGGEIEDGD
jgi:hypothetical protein